jgi:putative Holliday junction resolvase
VEQFVIGKPLNEKGETQQIQENIDKLSGYLTKVFPTIPQAFVDERYTSRMAKFALVEAGIKKEKRKDKKLLDSVSATLILQTYLQMNP